MKLFLIFLCLLIPTLVHAKQKQYQIVNIIDADIIHVLYQGKKIIKNVYGKIKPLGRCGNGAKSNVLIKTLAQSLQNITTWTFLIYQPSLF